jgi:CRP/FNR family transcriptional regulator, dissimilatory nitrate respiration regulator
MESKESLSLMVRQAALKSTDWFEGLSSEDINMLADFAVLKTYQKGDYVFREGEPTHGFFIVKSGAINIHRCTPGGKEKTIHLFRSGESFAEATLADGFAYPADARAEESSLLIYIPRIEFLSFLKRRPDIAIRMLVSLSQHLRILVKALDDMTGRDAETRLGLWLLHRCPQPLGTDPVEITLDVTKTLLASELRVRNETLSRALARLREENLIETSGRNVTIPNPERLEEALKQGIRGT